MIRLFKNSFFVINSTVEKYTNVHEYINKCIVYAMVIMISEVKYLNRDSNIIRVTLLHDILNAAFSH